MMPRPDYAREVRNALADPRLVVEKLGLSKGAKRQARGAVICCPAHGERNPSCSVITGPDGTLQVRCHACGWSGDALTLVAHVYQLDLRNQFREVLIAGAELAGQLALAHEIRGEEQAAQEPRRRVSAPPPPPPREYPPRDDVLALWQASGPVADDPDASRVLVGRRMDPVLIDRFGLARAISRQARLPAWAHYGRHTWHETGHRMVLLAVDCRGDVRSVRAWRIADGDTPKRLPPAGHRASELVLANRRARMMLRLAWCPKRLVIVEGEPDFLVAACAWPWSIDDAVIGIGSGSWTPHFARRVPPKTEVVVATHNDAAGDRYAEAVIETLGNRPVWRFNAAA